jgi:concanavalin A-like lectin/glucanase superfamily protein/VCBS repeat protein/type IX secretion system substrate protein
MKIIITLQQILTVISFYFFSFSVNTVFAQDPFPGTALNFDGIDNFVECGDSGSIAISNSLTIEAWIKVSSSFPASGRVGNIIGNVGQTPNFNFEGHQNGRLRFYWNNGEINVYATNFDMRDDAWHHVAVTRDSITNQIIFYTDGQVNGIFSAGSNADYHWPLGIGNDLRTPGIPFHGLIEEVRLWNVARTEQEIRENIHLTLTGSENGLISYWQFNEASSDTTYDPVGGNNGTLHNFDMADWITSTTPVGGGSSSTQIVSSTGTYNFTGTGLSMEFTAKSGTDNIVVSKLDLGPNSYPTIALADTFNSQYWIVNKFGSGTFTADLTFSPNEVITPEDESSPDALRLFNRESNSAGSWSNLIGATAAVSSINTVTFNNISSFSQFLIGRQWFTDINAGLTDVYYSSVVWGDYDNDGDLDILLTGQDASRNNISRIYHNDAGLFTDINAGLTGVANSSVAWGDYDNDGDLDILLTGPNLYGSYNYISRIYRNDPSVDGQARIFTDINAGLTGVGNSSAKWGDYDNDGDLDILITGVTGNPSNYNPISRIYRNDAGLFTDINAELPGVHYSSVAWGDYDNDGDLDILLTGYTSSGRISRIYRNDARVFTDINGGLTEVSSSSAAWGDYDNDGDLDILLSGSTGPSNISKIYRNDTGLFTDINAGLTGAAFSSADWGDYDNDGDLDILLSGSTGPSIISKIYLNNSSIPNTMPHSPNGLSAIISADSLSFSWNKASDNETPQDGLSYNLVLGNSEFGSMNPPMADTASGYRLIPAFGNVCQVTSWSLIGPYSYPQVMLPDYWGVQAVDHAFAGSEFAIDSINIPVNYLQTINNNIMQLTDLLSWEVQFGDSIVSYQVQIDDDSLFNSKEVDDTLNVSVSGSGSYFSMPLNTFTGSQNLIGGTKYYWRVKPNYTFGRPTVFTNPALSFWFGFVSAIDSEQELAIPKKFALQQNYPNPFNPATQIKYDLPRNAHVRIELFDMLGRKIKILIDEPKSAGYHTLNFNAGKLASGVYLYGIKAGNFSSTKKMLLMK